MCGNRNLFACFGCINFLFEPTCFFVARMVVLKKENHAVGGPSVSNVLIFDVLLGWFSAFREFLIRIRRCRVMVEAIAAIKCASGLLVKLCGGLGFQIPSPSDCQGSRVG